MNPFDLMKNVSQLQEKMAEAQKKMDSLRIEGTSGGGMVKIILDGTFKVHKVEIDPSVLGSEEKELVSFLVQSAFNEAHAQVKAKLQSELSSSMGGLLPGSGFPL